MTLILTMPSHVDMATRESACPLTLPWKWHLWCLWWPLFTFFRVFKSLLWRSKTAVSDTKYVWGLEDNFIRSFFSINLICIESRRRDEGDLRSVILKLFLTPTSLNVLILFPRPSHLYSCGQQRWVGRWEQFMIMFPFCIFQQ